MAQSAQQQARIRKFVYIGLIIALFTVSYIHRKWVIEPKAFSLQLREAAQGRPELTSSAVRLTLLGSRGLATCVLWQMALEKQIRHQWTELEMLVRSITTLQPHFVSPWLFQSWNLAFNVAVECDRTRDKYFYVSRGLHLLAEGERRHQGAINPEGGADDSSAPMRFPGNPDMRFNLGFFYQLKIGTSDEKNAMRCLLDLSCIDPVERDPERFYIPDERGRGRVIDMNKFLDFTARHPRLVRRLREKLRCSTPKDVLAFLEQNKGIPSRFDEKAPPDQTPDGPQSKLLEPADQQFPILPDLPTLNRNAREFALNFDVFTAAKLWYLYAQEPLPPPSPELHKPTPEFDALRYRLPKMMSQVFRGYPARAQAFIAENRQDEGWFDEDGWLVTDWFRDLAGREGDGEIRVGREEKYHSIPAWDEAESMYRDYGTRTGLLLSPEMRAKLQEKAKLFRDHYGIENESSINAELPQDQRDLYNGQMGESFDAHQKLAWNLSYRTTTNFDAHYTMSSVEKLPEVMRVRKTFYYADKKREQSDDDEALRLYTDALNNWILIMAKYPVYRSLDQIQMEAYKQQMRWVRLMQSQNQEFLNPFVIGMARFGMVEPYFGLLATKAPFFEVPSDEQRRIIPIRRVQGPYEMIYMLEMPERESLQDCLLVLSHAANPVPFIVHPYERYLQLVSVTTRPRSEISQPWYPLLTNGTIQQGREELGLDRVPTSDSGNAGATGPAGAPSQN